MPGKRQIEQWIGPDDFRREARRRLPKLFFDYLDGAAGGERTASENMADFGRIRFLPHVLRAVAETSTQTAFLGEIQRLPLLLGPIGSLGQFRANAERSAFRVAKRRGIPACLSSFATTRPETLTADLPPAAAFQLYVLKDFDRTQSVIERVAAAGFATLVVTVDTPVSGIRERDVRNGLRQASRLSPGNLLGMAARPSWLLDMARTHPVRMALAEGWPEAGRNYMSQAAFLAGQIDANLTWETLARIRALWPGRFLLKGIMRRDDLWRAIDAGCDGAVLSNHGGRQLEDCPSTISVLSSLPPVPEGFELILDGGVRRGADVVKAVALGATACALGRVYAYALAAAGEPGLERLLDCFQAEIEATLRLLGVGSIDALHRHGRELLATPWMAQIGRAPEADAS